MEIGAMTKDSAIGHMQLVLALLFAGLFLICSGGAGEGANCTALPNPGNVVVNVSTAAGLVQAVSAANSAGGNRTIRVAAGTYTLGTMLVITAPDITIRGATGNRDDVVLQGAGMSGGVAHVFLVQSDRFTIADLTLGRVANHGIQVQGEHDADDLLVHNVRVIDTGEQMLKVTYSTTAPDVRADRGIVRCSLFEYTAGIGPQYYIGGIDAHHAMDWEVRDSVFRSIRSPDASLAEHAIHFWSDSRNTVVERNIIVGCDRGIGFGLGSSTHTGGVIRNNMVYSTRDVGIGLESSAGTKVLNNTVYADNYSNAIEYRFAATQNVTIRANLTRGAIQLRNGAGGTVSDNYTSATADFFVNAADGNLRLKTAVPVLVDAAPVLAEVVDDIDGRFRPVGSAPDFGAHEWSGGISVIEPSAPDALTVQ